MPLSISVHPHDDIVIGDPKKPIGHIRVVEVKGDKVTIAFHLPRELGVNRKVVADRKAKA